MVWKGVCDLPAMGGGIKGSVGLPDPRAYLRMGAVLLGLHTSLHAYCASQALGRAAMATRSPLPTHVLSSCVPLRAGAFPCKSTKAGQRLSYSSGEAEAQGLSSCPSPHQEPHPSLALCHGPGQVAIVLRPVSPLPLALQSAKVATSGPAVLCSVTAVVVLTVTLSAGSATVWMATQGPRAGKVSGRWGRGDHTALPPAEDPSIPHPNHQIG